MKRFVILLSLLVLTACSSPAAPSTPLPDPQPPGNTSEKPSTPELETLLSLVNAARASGQVCGGQTYPSVAPLSWNAALGISAQKHSEDMNAAGKMSHATPEGAIHYQPGSSPFERMTQEGYTYQTAGENVAWGYPTAEAVMQGWLSSSGHCKNMMNANFTEIGLGLEGSYWTQVFARPR